MGDLPGISWDDPQNLLSADARRRINAAISEAGLLRARALADAETRFRSQKDQSSGFSEYCETGKGAIAIAKSRLRSAQLILTAELTEYRAVGIQGSQLREIAHDNIDAVSNSFELTSTQQNLLREEFPGLEHRTFSWAVCQRPANPTLRQPPRLFSSMQSAEAFLNEKLFTGVQNKNQGWLDPLPVVPISRTGETKRRTFREFLPPERIAKTIPAVSFDEALEQVFEGTYPEITCALSREWWFAGIVGAASKRPGHHYTGVQYDSVPEIVLRAVYDLEDSLVAKFGAIPNGAIADFFRSWQVWNYMSGFATKVAASATAIQVAGHSWTAKDQAARVVDVLFEQFCVYAHELMPSAKPATVTTISTIDPATEPSSGVAPRRSPGTINSALAAERMQRFIEASGMGQTQFATGANTTDRTIRSFTRTGKVRKDIFRDIAKAMGTTPEELLKP